MNPKWTARFIELAQHVAAWSKDPSTKVGAVIVEPNSSRVISMGFNGPPRFVTDDYWLSERGLKLACTLHAEHNAVLFAKEPLVSAHLFCSHPPCVSCTAIAIQAGIVKISHPEVSAEFGLRWANEIHLAHELAKDAGLVIEVIL